MLSAENDHGMDAFIAKCEFIWNEQNALSEPRYRTRAPARLDVMGGFADYTGSLVLQCALPLEVRAAIAPRNDQKVSLTSLGWSNNGDHAQCVWPLSVLYTNSGKIASPENVSAHFEACGCPWARHIAGVYYTLLEAGAVPHFGGGASIILESDIPPHVGLGSSAAISVATGRLLSALSDRAIDPLELARLCQRAENLIVGLPTGITDKVASLLSEPGSLLQMLCQPHELRGFMQLCPGTTLVGIDSGVQVAKKTDKFVETRVASFMGLRIIENSLRNGPTGHDLIGGYLANITPTDYVEHFRDKLPTKMRGRDFLEKYGHLSDSATRVSPETIYKVRSRTEHHIYENDRVHRFAERMYRASRTGERDALVEAGELMYASHWSYSQRCGMGSIETDLLINLLREQGVTKGIYGAKVTGGGCGGVLAVLMMDSPVAREALDDVCRNYAAKVGKEARIFSGFATGAAAAPPQRVEASVHQ